MEYYDGNIFIGDALGTAAVSSFILKVHFFFCTPSTLSHANYSCIPVDTIHELSVMDAGMDPVLLEFSDVCRYFLGRGEALQPNSSTIPVMENKTFTCDVYCPMDESLPPLLEERGSQPLVDSWFPSSWDFDQLWQLQVCLLVNYIGRCLIVVHWNN
ncbi:hypothetical protein ANCDUO_23321 [Ancylostoma duodenale]|uniref:Uncharacterized protein n=1 Tax=Ancylostoma duodenale TaxID=51022 RepID=A0A0C2FIS2_9BILA|nr:hypothetical protein ANCDUO_23321 [Ancylostoma duodenale]